MARKQMHTWIAEAVADPDKDGKITQITLVHVVGGGGTREIHTTKFSSGKNWTAKDLADMFRGKAETFCQDLPGVQTFNLLCFYGGRNTPEAAFPFIVNSTQEMAHGHLSTEPPTAEGRTMQSMRQSEMVFQQVYRRQQQLDEQSIRLLEVQNRMLFETMSENREMFSLMKELMTQVSDNGHKHRMAELQYERQTETRAKVMKFLPPLVNTILGREVFPQSTEDTALVESIADSLSEADVMKIAEVLRPEQLGPLMGRVERYLAQKREAEERKQRTNGIVLRSGLANPEAEAAGDPTRAS